MKLKAKFNLAIVAIFGLLAVVTSVITVRWVDLTTFRNATERVHLNINSAWLVYDNHRAMIERHADLLASEVRALDRQGSTGVHRQRSPTALRAVL